MDAGVGVLGRKQPSKADAPKNGYWVDRMVRILASFRDLPRCSRHPEILAKRNSSVGPLSAGRRTAYRHQTCDSGAAISHWHSWSLLPSACALHFELVWLPSASLFHLRALHASPNVHDHPPLSHEPLYWPSWMSARLDALAIPLLHAASLPRLVLHRLLPPRAAASFPLLAPRSSLRPVPRFLHFAASSRPSVRTSPPSCAVCRER